MLKVYHVLQDLVPFVQFEKCENVHGGMSFLKLQAYITKSDTPVDGCFAFFN